MWWKGDSGEPMEQVEFQEETGTKKKDNDLFCSIS